MATMKFSIPDDIEKRFNRTFAGQNKSAIVARLLEEAIARAERKQQSDAAIDRILARRGSNPGASTEEILGLRDEVRADSDAGHDSEAK